MPALAVADALRQAGASVSFIGTRERAEAELVPQEGYEIDFLAVRGLDRKNPVRAAGAVAKAARAVSASRKILKDRGADAVMGGGGYVAFPAGAAAASLGIPLVLTEADSHLGLTNRMLARTARRVCLAFEIEGRDGDLYLHTGRPVARNVRLATRAASRERFELDPEVRCLLVFGGSLGARTINEAVAETFGASGPGANRGFEILHVTGSRDYEAIAEKVGDAPGYRVEEYLLGLGEALAACDLVLARSGGSVFEMTAAGKPAILAPYPYASGLHQHTNARWMERAGAAIMVEDADLTSQWLLDNLVPLIEDTPRLDEMTAASKRLAMPDAAERIAAEILSHV